MKARRWLKGLVRPRSAEQQVIHRVYFWLDGTPEDRPAGPWWYRDLRDPRAVERLVDDISEFCVELWVAELPFPTPPMREWNIYPPDNARPLKTTRRWPPGNPGGHDE